MLDGVKSLILNVSYEPIMVVEWHRAFSLLFSGRASVVENYPELKARTVLDSFDVPAVITLHRYIKPRKIVNFSKRSIHIRDNFTCQYCNKRQKKSELSIDHIIPSSKGGRTVWSNIVTSCIGCNRKKSNLSLSDVGFKLLREPKQPLSIFNFLWDLPLDKIPKEWEEYIGYPIK